MFKLSSLTAMYCPCLCCHSLTVIHSRVHEFKLSYMTACTVNEVDIDIAMYCPCLRMSFMDCYVLSMFKLSFMDIAICPCLSCHSLTMYCPCLSVIRLTAMYCPCLSCHSLTCMLCDNCPCLSQCH